MLQVKICNATMYFKLCLVVGKLLSNIYEGTFCENNEQIFVANYFRRIFHYRCLTDPTYISAVNIRVGCRVKRSVVNLMDLTENLKITVT